MAMAYYKFCVCFLIVFVMRISYSEGQKVRVPAIFAFGDSQIDVGNNNHLELSILKADFPWNGIDYPDHKPTGRYSNGRNAADFLAEKLGLPTSPPYLSVRFDPNITKVVLEKGGISFASGGAGVLNETHKIFRQSISLSQQIEYYTEVHEDLVAQLGSSEVEKFLAKSVFLVAIGSNDLLGFFQPNSKLRKTNSPQQYISTLMVALKNQLKQIYMLGARKFAVVGVGLIGCCPSMRSKNETNGCMEEANFWSVKYNEDVQSLMQDLKAELPDINYSFFSTYNIVVDFVQRPALYGFSEVETACCGRGKFRGQFPCLFANLCKNRTNHLFWDLYHPTEAAARIVMDKFYAGSQLYVNPMSISQLVSL